MAKLLQFLAILATAACFTGHATAAVRFTRNDDLAGKYLNPANAAQVMNSAVEDMPEKQPSRQRRSIMMVDAPRNTLNLNLRPTGLIVSNLEDAERKDVQQTIIYTIPYWEEMLSNNFETGILQFETNTSFNLTARWRMVVQESQGKLVFFLILMESNQNPVYALYNVEILKNDLTRSPIVYSSRYPINRYDTSPGQRQLWGWKLPEISALQDPANGIITENKLTMRVTVTTYGKGHPLYTTPTATNLYGVLGPIQVETVTQNYSSIDTFLQTLRSLSGSGSVELSRVWSPFTLSSWYVFVFQPTYSKVVLWGTQIATATVPIYASYKVNIVFENQETEPLEFGFYDQIFKFDRTDNFVINNLNTIAELEQKAKTYSGPIQIVTYLKIYRGNAILGENVV
jgi:hypothetical protein